VSEKTRARIETPARPQRPAADPAPPTDLFVHRHIGPREAEIQAMLETLGVGSLEALIDATIPASIRMRQPFGLGKPRGESDVLRELQDLASRNQVFTSCIGMGYHSTLTPPVILRNVLENPGWYTQYTPYQSEISQGRLEALLLFQTLTADLTGLPLATASLLDEATAAAEAAAMCFAIAGGRKGQRRTFFVAHDCHPQTVAVVRTRAESLGMDTFVARVADLDLDRRDLCGALLQFPATDGRIVDYADVVARLHAVGALAVVATDLLALCLLRPPGEWGADIAVGSAQRFGMPIGFGGPHAAFLATRAEHVRRLPGRIVGVSKDSAGKVGYRLTLQTREQHIRREHATSNICTAQALPAIVAAFYAVYHGPDGLRRIARRVHALTAALAAGVEALGHDPGEDPYFDTLRVRLGSGSARRVLEQAAARRIHLRPYDESSVGIALDETTTPEVVQEILAACAGGAAPPDATALLAGSKPDIPAPFARRSEFLGHPHFQRYHSETEMLRFMARLESRDLSLVNSMIPLGSCTMKLNATTEMMPMTWPGFAALHPFAEPEQTQGYAELFRRLERQLAEITGFAAVSLQPNAGSQGEYTGLLVIRAWNRGRGQPQRDVCLIPVSAHGTNPASASIAGYRVVAVACDAHGNIELADLRAKAAAHRDTLGAIMVTYPSTHGVFEPEIREVCDVVHASGGQVYLDGANMNAQVGLVRPADIGADVCHLNLHKTFCIPHGGGGPGMGPIAVAAHLAPYLPGHPVARPASAGAQAIGPVSAAPYGSPAVLPISYAYIALMGGEGLVRASQVAILNANYMAKRLSGHYDVLFTGQNGRVAHEFILDLRDFDKTAGIKADDVAKRLMDYGFHAPTMSFPVPGTLMVEPTESESKAELDRFCDAMIAIRTEIAAIEAGRMDRDDNPLRNAPHTAAAVARDDWNHPYSRQQAAFPAPWLHEFKFWPHVGRIDNYYGDRNLFCTCPPLEAFES
jgi:glycine cleavage system P protein (glycine dehydrogenase)